MRVVSRLADSRVSTISLGAVSLAWARLNEPLSPVAAREVARVKSLRIRLLLAAEAAHGQIFEKIDRGHRAEAVAAASGQSPTGPSSPWPALMTLNGAARTYAGLPLAHSKLAVLTAVGCDGNGEQTIGKHADACIESLCLPASVPQVGRLK